MLEILGKNYYIDLDGITEKCVVPDKKVVKEETDDSESGGIGDQDEKPVLEINIFKYEVIKMCIDRVFSEFEDDDNDKLFKTTSASFNLAFNTLIKYDIIIEDEDE